MKATLETLKETTLITTEGGTAVFIPGLGVTEITINFPFQFPFGD